MVMDAERSPRASWRWAGAAVAVVVLLGVGVIAGATLFGTGGDRPLSEGPYQATHPTGPTGSGGSARRHAAGVVDMTGAKGVVCRPPVAPGPGHRDRLVSELFNVRDGQRTYLLGWQVVPYRGPGTYTLADSGNMLALEPATGGAPLGFGKGTLTFFGTADSGTVHAVVSLHSGGSLRIQGPWICVST